MTYWFLDGGGEWRHLINYMCPQDKVIGSNTNINKFFQEFTPFTTINLRCKPTLYEGSFLSIIKNIFRVRKDYKEHFSHLRNEIIFADCVVATLSFFSFIKKLSKHNRVFFCARKGVIDEKFNLKEYYGLHWLPMKLIGLILGVNINITKVLDKPLWYVKKGRLGEKGYMEYNLVEPTITFPIKYQALLEGKDTLVLLNDLKTLAYSPRNASDMVASLLDKETTIVKNHTRNPKIYGTFNDFMQFPEYMPAELLIANHKWKNIITLYVSKTSLHDSDAKKICAYNLIDWKIPVKAQWIYDVTKHHTLLPKTKEEFKEMLA